MGAFTAFLFCKMQNDDLINTKKQKENPPASKRFKKFLFILLGGVIALGLAVGLIFPHINIYQP